MRFFLDCKKEISFYMKELTLFELDERNFPNCGNCLSALFLSYRVLFHSHSDHLPILWQMYIFLYTGYCKQMCKDLTPMVHFFVNADK